MRCPQTSYRRYQVLLDTRLPVWSSYQQPTVLRSPALHSSRSRDLAQLLASDGGKMGLLRYGTCRLHGTKMTHRGERASPGVAGHAPQPLRATGDSEDPQPPRRGGAAAPPISSEGALRHGRCSEHAGVRLGGCTGRICITSSKLPGSLGANCNVGELLAWSIFLCHYKCLHDQIGPPRRDTVTHPDTSDHSLG